MHSFEESLGELDRAAGLSTELRPASEETPSDHTPLRLTASGDDPAAAVFRLSHLMRVLNVNIENLETSSVVPRTSGTHAGGFTLEMDLSVPRATPVMMLKQYVQALAEELGIESDVKNL
jgi:glycine cleavage system regulatory protein